MVRFQLARDGVLGVVDAFSNHARQEVVRARQEAQAAAERAFRRTQQNAAVAAARLQKEAARVQAQLAQATQPAVRRQQSGGSPRPAPRSIDDLSLPPLAQAAAIHLAQQGGRAVGVVRGGVHAVEGVAKGAAFVGRLASGPFDEWLSPPGESASDQLRGAFAEGANYVRGAVEDPQRVVQDVRNAAHQLRVELDPSFTPAASTLEQELQRQFEIGMNQGELAFDVGTLAVGGPLAKGAKRLGGISKPSTAEKYIAQGFTPAEAAHLAAPYPARNRGHHYIPLRVKPPPIFAESVFNILRPEGITRGDFYELHFKVDPKFKTTGLLDGVWSGDALGLKKYGQLGRIWHGSPAPLKARVGGLGATTGSAVHSAEVEGDAR
jgi:hypothetical protein